MSATHQLSLYSLQCKQHIDCTMPLSQEEWPQEGQGTCVQLQVLPLCTNNVPGKTFS